MKRNRLQTLVAALAAAIAPALAFGSGGPVTNTDTGTSYATIQEAVTAASPGDTISVAPGVYTGHVLIGKSLTLAGPNAALTGADEARGPEAIIEGVVRVDANDVVVSGLMIDGTNVDQGPALAKRGVHIGNTVFSTGVTVENNVIKNWATGVSTAERNADIVIQGNLLVSAGIGSTENCAGLTILNNTFDADARIGLGGGVQLAAPIAGNTFMNGTGRYITNYDATLAGQAGFFDALLADNTYDRAVVIRDATEAVVGNAIYATITSAVGAAVANAGQIVDVAAGTYDEAVLVNKNGLTLRGAPGADPKPTILVSGSTGLLGTVALPAGSSDITIEGLEIIGIDGPPGLEKGAIYLAGGHTNLTIRGNTITANGDAAIQTEWGGVINGMTIEGNLINGTTFQAPGTGGPGGGGQFVEENWPRSLVYIGNAPSKSNITFKDNVIDAISGDANNGNVMINIDGNGVLISGNTFGGSTGTLAGISYLRARGSDTAISGNTLSGEAGVAVYIGDGDTNSFTGNALTGAFGVALVNAGGTYLNANANYWGSADPDLDSLLVGNVLAGTYYTDADLENLVKPNVYVSADYDASTPGWGSTHFSTIAAGISAVDTGGTVHVAAGTYNFASQMNIQKAVTLRGPNADANPTAGGARDAEAILSGSVNRFIRIRTGGVTIEGFTLTSNARTAVWVNGADEVNGLLIRNNIFDANAEAFGSSNATINQTISDLVFVDNWIKNNTARSFSHYTGVPGENFLISGNQITDSLAGIHLGYVSGTEVSNNTIQLGNDLNWGILLADTISDVRVEGNTFGLSGAGVSFWGMSNIQGEVNIVGNTFDGLAVYDIGIRQDAGEFTHATLVSIEGNRFLNSTVAVWNQSDESATANANYWGSAAPDLALLIDGAVTVTNLYTDADLTDLRYLATHVAADYDASTPGWGEYAFASIQDAVNATAAGGTVNIAAGTYAENIVTTVPMTLQGEGAATVISPGSGAAVVTLAAGTSATQRSVLRNVQLLGPGSVDGVRAGSHTTLDGVVSSGHSNYGLRIATGTDLIIVGSSFDNNKVGLNLPSEVSFTGITISGSTFDNNEQHGWYDDASKTTQPVLANVTITNSSFSGNGMKGLYTERLENAVLDNLTVANNANDAEYGFGAGIDINLKWRAFSDITVRNSTFTNNGNGSANGAALTIKARDDAPSYGGSNPAASLHGVLVENCTFVGNERDFVSGEPGKSNAGPTGVVIRRSVFGDATSGGVVNHSLATVDANANYWGTNEPVLEAPLVIGLVDAASYYTDADRLNLEFLGDGAIADDTTVDPDSTLTVPGELTLTANLTVNGGTLSVGSLNLAPGAVLQINEGTLILGDGSVMSGTFTFFDSLGSVHFDGDIEITGSATGLILVTDVHVADGATITVDGTLIIDGSVVDSPGTFTLEVGEGASFTMVRTVFVNGALELNSGDVKVYDNRFENSTISVGQTADGAMVYHNLTDNLGWLSDGGLNTVTMVDGWSNVDAAEPVTHNNLLLGLDIGALPTDRTTDEHGNVYIQPGDTVAATVDISALQDKVSGIEMLLGYNTSLLEASSLGLEESTWDVVIDSVTDTSGVIGKLDAALGLSFTFADPAGSDADQVVADVALTALTTESRTQFFHRVKLAEDAFGGDTRLTVGGPSPSYLAPFTANSAIITIDGTAPVIDEATATVEQDGVDMTIEGNITIQGDLDITVAAMDALAGIDAVKAVVTLMQDEVVVYTADQTGTAPVTIDDVDYTQYAFTYTVTPATENGLYDVVFTVTDRSGNTSSANLGVVEINKNQVAATITLQGVDAAELERTVTLVFTDETEAVIETRTPAVTFIEGTATVTLTNVPETAVRLSAKTDWTLRQRVELDLVDGQAAPEYLLRGGDLNDDNVVNMFDFSILRYYWLTDEAAADITGDGAVNMTDYQILQSNFYATGDPQ